MSAIVLASSLVGGCAESTAPSGPSGPPEIQPITFWEKHSTNVTGDLAAAAVAYVKQSPELTERGGDWKVRATTTGKDKLRHVRMSQLHEGVRVWGGDVVLHANDAQFLSVKGNRVKNLEGFDVVPSIASEAALRVAKADYQRAMKGGSAAALAFSREASELVIFPQKGRDARLVWHTVFFTELQAGVKPGLWNYFIDAKTGEIVGQFNGIHTLSQASGAGGNPKVARTWNMELDVEPQGAQFKMDTARLKTFNMNQTTTTETLVVGPLNPIGDAAINDAHGFAEVMLNMLTEWMGHNSIDDNGFVIKSRVHYDFQFENAFWDGTQMTYGDGATTFHPLSGDVDVVAHEIAHGFTTFHSNLIYDDQSGGMNESFSDISGTIAEFFDEGDAADFDIGRDIFKGNAALRFMCDPTADGISIDNFANYSDSLDVHFSSGIQNKAFCRAARRFASGSPTGAANTASVRRVGEAFYEANASHWTESSTFQQGCQGVLDAAAGLGFSTTERAALRDSWADVGVFCDGIVEPVQCDDTFTTDTGEVTSPNFPNPYGDNFTRTYCIHPTSGNPVTVTFPSFSTESGFDFVTVKDGVSGTVLSTTSGAVAPADATSSFIVIKFTTDASVVASGWRATWGAGPINMAPTVAITAPAEGAVVSGTVAVSATAVDPDGTVSKVSFVLPDGTTVDDTTAPYAVTWNSTTVADGLYAIKAKAFDNLGVASVEKTVNIDVTNAVPCVDGTFSSTHAPVAIPDNFPGGVASTVNVFSPGNIGSLALSLNITHTWRGDLRVILVAPTGQQFVVHDRTGSAADNLVLTNVDLPAFVGVPAAGPWTLRVIDAAAQDVGTLNNWSMTIVGNCAPSGEFIGKAEPNLPIVDNSAACSTLTVTGGGGDASNTRLDLDGIHDFRSILRATLSHNGTTVDAFTLGTFPTGAGSFSLADKPIAGLSGNVNGTWELCVIDTDGFGDTGTLQSWSVHD